MNNKIEGEDLFGGLDLARAVYPSMQSARTGLTLDNLEKWQHDLQKQEGLDGHLLLEAFDRKRGIESSASFADVEVLCARHSVDGLFARLRIGPGDILGLPKSAFVTDDGIKMPALARLEAGVVPIIIPLDAKTKLGANVSFLRLNS